MKRYLLTIAIVLSVSSGCFGAPPEICLPPFTHPNRKGSYDVELKRTEFLNGKPYPPVEGTFHVDVTDNSIRVVKRFTYTNRPKFQTEYIYSKDNGSLLTIDTKTGTAPSRVVYMRRLDDEAAFYAGFYGVSIINGYFWNIKKSLWDSITAHSDELKGKNKLALPEDINVEVLQRDGYWLLRHIRTHHEKSQRRLHSPKFYAFKAPSQDLLSLSQVLDCEYSVDDRKQKYSYELSCKYEKDEAAVVREDITVQNYRSEVAVLPLSADDVYAPTLVAVPNGTNVGVVNEEVIDYMWQDGRIVRRIDRKALDSTKSVSFRRSSRTRLIWGASFLGLILLILAVRLWLRRKAKASS